MKYESLKNDVVDDVASDEPAQREVIENVSDTDDVDVESEQEHL